MQTDQEITPDDRRQFEALGPRLVEFHTRNYNFTTARRAAARLWLEEQRGNRKTIGTGPKVALTALALLLLGGLAYVAADNGLQVGDQVMAASSVPIQAVDHRP